MVGLKILREAKVNEPGVAASGNQDVVWLDIAVDDL